MCKWDRWDTNVYNNVKYVKYDVRTYMNIELKILSKLTLLIY